MKLKMCKMEVEAKMGNELEIHACTGKLTLTLLTPTNHNALFLATN